MLRDFFKIALNNLKRRKLRSWLTMVGIFIGIAAVVGLISLGQGLQTAITGQFESMGSDYLTVTNAETGFGPPGSTAIDKLTDHDLKIVENVRGVKKAAPILLRTLKIEYNKIVSFSMARGVSNNAESLQEEYDALGLKTADGRLLKIGDNKKVLLGNDFSKDTKFDKPVEVGKKIKISGEEFEVIGILKSSGNFMINGAILIFYEDLKEIEGIDDEIDMIGLTIKNTEEASDVAERIEKALRKDRDLKEGEEDFAVQTPAQVISTVNTILDSINIVVVGIAMISLIVGGVGIANTMYTSVLERRKEIGTMKAIGARNSNILSIFLIESGLLGLVGGIVGASLGALFALGVGSVANNALGTSIIQVDVSFSLIISAISFSFLLGILFGAIPSYQASKLPPTQALRG